MNLRAYARAQLCQVRLPGVCNRNVETTVLAHLRMVGIHYEDGKAPDFQGAWCCSSCHAYVDTHDDDATQRAFYEGIFRTQSHLRHQGWITW